MKLFHLSLSVLALSIGILLWSVLSRPALTQDTDYKAGPRERSAPPQSALPAAVVRPAPVARVVEGNTLTQAGRMSAEQFQAELHRLLREQPGLAFGYLADIDLRIIPPNAVSQAYLAYFQESGDLAQGLAGIASFSEHHSLNASLVPDYLALVAQTSPEQALAWCLEQDSITGLGKGLQQLGALAGNSPTPSQQIESVLASEINEYDKAAYLSEALSTWIDHTPAAAMEYFSAFPPSELMDDVATRNIQKIAALDYEVALGWIEFITNEADQEHALSLISAHAPSAR